MTVGELIAELAKQDQTATVYVDGCDCVGNPLAVYFLPKDERDSHYSTSDIDRVLISRKERCPHGEWDKYLCEVCDG